MNMEHLGGENPCIWRVYHGPALTESVSCNAHTTLGYITGEENEAQGPWVPFSRHMGQSWGANPMLPVLKVRALSARPLSPISDRIHVI